MPATALVPPSLLPYLAIASGGAAGAVLRYQVAGWVQAWALRTRPDWQFPWGTFAVNLSGCLLLGLLAGLFADRLTVHPDVRSLLLIGLLGSYTTFSTFSLEALYLLQAQRFTAAAIYGLGSPLLGLLGAWCGQRLASL